MGGIYEIQSGVSISNWIIHVLWSHGFGASSGIAAGKVVETHRPTCLRFSIHLEIRGRASIGVVKKTGEHEDHL